MSFFRNIRSSITRGKSSSRDTTPVKASSSLASSRAASVVSSTTSRRDSADSHADSSVLNRGETFILGSDQEEKSNSNSSTLEKKSKKSKVLGKFSTFTKRKKTPVQPVEVSTFEHHPSDNATNTYYKWNSDGTGSSSLSSNVAVDYDAQTDPFNFLYEQHSNLKLLQNGVEVTDSRGGVVTKNHGHFDSSTYRKGKATSQLKAQLEHLKQNSTGTDLCEEDHEPDADKYKTVTLNSFRKSFRDKYLQQQKDAAYNPSWFIEVEAPAKSANEQALHGDAKENRPEYLVFENDNYRPGSRSPVRDRSNANGGGVGRQSRSTTRSPVKRNETFRVERSSLDKTPGPENSASIRVEIKNSVMPHVPGRMVPVGVAKPMPSTQPSNYYRTPSNVISYHHTNTITPATAARVKAVSPQRSAYKSGLTATTPTNQASRAGRYQTLIQISNDNNAASKLAASPPFGRRSRSISTRIQLGGASQSAAAPKLNNSIGSRYSYAGVSPSPSTLPSSIQATSPVGLSSYELLRSTKPQRLKHTYFGGDMSTNTGTSPTRLLMSPTNAAAVTTTRLTGSTPTIARTSNNFQTSYQNSQNINISPNKLRLPPSSAMSCGASPTTAGYMANRRDQHQSRHIIPMQRRSRSPIKIPWR